MYQTLRSFLWMVLVFSGLAITLAIFIFGSNVNAFAALVISIVTWVAYGVLSGWLFGLKRYAVRHMQSSIDGLTFISKDVGASRWGDIVRTLEHLYESEPGVRFGVEAYMDLNALKAANLSLQKVDWQTIEAEDGDLINIPSNSVYLLKCDGVPFIAKLNSAAAQPHAYEHEDAWTTGKGNTLQLCARSLEQANRVTRWLTGQASKHSIYRGQMLQVASPQDGTLGQTIRITKRPSASREKIVLPPAIFDTLERLIHARHQHGKHLDRLGHSAKLGILLYGPPGTGKTLVTRYLIQCSDQHTVICPTDMAVETLRESFRLANYLQPSILVLEDVDLLAHDRESFAHVEGLQELMNQMDGLASSCDTIVIMSTNRPAVLEPALASRPGRVSQAIEFLLPGEDDRRALLQMFLGDAQSSDLSIDHWVQRTHGSSPAFLQELCKRAILLASERSEGDSAASLKVNQEDLTEAIHELVIMGGTLTAKALGFPEDFEF